MTIFASIFSYVLIGATLNSVVGGFPVQPFSQPFSLGLLSRALPIGTCDPETPWPNGACCGSNGLCGYSPKECGDGCPISAFAEAHQTFAAMAVKMALALVVTPLSLRVRVPMRTNAPLGITSRGLRLENANM